MKESSSSIWKKQFNKVTGLWNNFLPVPKVGKKKLTKQVRKQIGISRKGRQLRTNGTTPDKVSRMEVGAAIIMGFISSHIYANKPV